MSFSLNIQPVAADGIRAWLVEDHAVPVVSVAWGWDGGAALDAPGAAGTANMAAALLTEGAGTLGAEAFADALRDRAIGLSFAAGRDDFDGGFRALTDALPEAVRLARLAMVEPRLEASSVSRVRARAAAAARRALETPSGQARRAFWGAAFPDHPAGRPPGGSVEGIAAVTEAGLRDLLGQQLRRNGLTVAAAGAITAPQLAALLGQLFDGLPAGAPPPDPALPPIRAFGREVLDLDGPQAAIVFGTDGLPVLDPEWEAAQVALRILAGGGFSSRLMQAVRVERGLAYGIGAGLDVVFGRGIVLGSVATENARAAETLSVLRAEWTRMAANGPTEAELADAVAFLTGNLPLQFSDTRRIADILLGQQRNGRAIDWLASRATRLRGLTRERVATAAARLFDPAALSVVVAGRPAGL